MSESIITTGVPGGAGYYEIDIRNKIALLTDPDPSGAYVEIKLANANNA